MVRSVEERFHNTLLEYTKELLEMVEECLQDGTDPDVVRWIGMLENGTLLSDTVQDLCDTADDNLCELEYDLSMWLANRPSLKLRNV